MDTFKALLLEQPDGQLQVSIKQLPLTALPAGEVLVAIAYASLNYKDGLAITGKGKIARHYPLIPGVDFAGTVKESQVATFKPGDQVILTGWGVGERHWGGFAQLARVKAEWLLPLPKGLSLQQAMGFGSAGFTAMQCVLALEEHGLTPGEREVVVTGAAGGVGSCAVALLAQRGYNVVASTGRPSTHPYLRELGAKAILAREVLAGQKRPLESERWAGAVDTVGGTTLAGLLSTMAHGSSVTMCGLAGGSELATTVFPFILRGVNLLGIDSVKCPFPRRQVIWERLAQDFPLELLAKMTQIAPLESLPGLAKTIVDGQIQGRIIVDVNAEK